MDRAIGENVQRLRRGLGLSKEALAKRVGYATQAMIHQIEVGAKLPSPHQLWELAKALGVTVSDLFGDKVPPGMINNANGDHQVVYQHVDHVKGSVLMTEELQGVLRTIVREELAASREVFKAEVREILREVAREADDEPGTEA